LAQYLCHVEARNVVQVVHPKTVELQLQQCPRLRVASFDPGKPTFVRQPEWSKDRCLAMILGNARHFALPWLARADDKSTRAALKRVPIARAATALRILSRLLRGGKCSRRVRTVRRLLIGKARATAGVREAPEKFLRSGTLSIAQSP
jgi:hypothetical protein